MTTRIDRTADLDRLMLADDIADDDIEQLLTVICESTIPSRLPAETFDFGDIL